MFLANTWKHFVHNSTTCVAPCVEGLLSEWTRLNVTYATRDERFGRVLRNLHVGSTSHIYVTKGINSVRVVNSWTFVRHRKCLYVKFYIENASLCYNDATELR
jgi:hypothetical protein